MILKTLTWNIGGGKLLAEGADPGLMASYTVDGLQSVIEVIQRENPDIITLQETQKNAKSDQVKAIAKAIGFDYFVHDITSTSHLDAGSELGHGVISRYPLTSHETGFFNNPHVSVVWEDGRTVSTFDKGYTNCMVDVAGRQVQVSTLHLTPFRRFAIELDSELGRTMLADVEARVAITPECYLLQGDFNIDSKSLQPFLPRLFGGGVEEIITPEPTTPKDRTYDHILFKGMKIMDYSVDTTVTTDHYPVLGVFEII